MSVIVKVIIAIVIGALLMTGIGFIVNNVALPTAKDRVSTMFEQEYTPSINGGSGGGGVQPTTSPTLAAGLYDNNDNLLMSWSELVAEYPDSIFVESGPMPDDVAFGEMYGGDTLNGKLIIADSVTSIGEEAFYGCNSLTSITIPSKVTSIDDYAFYDCKSLTSIIIPDSITSIGYMAFYDTAYYNDEANWENGALYIGKYLISGKLEKDDEIITEVKGNYSIKSGTKVIAPAAFSGCSSLASITIPDTVTNIGDNAFYCCSSLTSIIIPNGVTSIRSCAFYCCSSLTSITIPSKVTSIGEWAFQGTKLTSITIPDSVTSIGAYAFACCQSLTSIAVDKNNKVYDSRNNCNAIIETKSNTLIQGCCNTIIPNSVTRIGRQAFEGCKSLESITIPDSVTSIGDCAFRNCTSLTNITIPNSVTTIGYQAFRNCGFKSVTIPESVTSIGEQAFNGCSSGLTIYGKAGSYAETYADDWSYNFVAI